jgi:fido (protein-threonine AMPylation protein)
MALPAVKLADSLAVLKTLQDEGHVAIRASDLTRTHRERLLRTGFIREVMKGWYVPARPDEAPGESTAWYASFWAFAAVYLRERFDDDWCLSPEQSLSLLTGDWTVPRQLLVRTPKGGNKPTALLFNTSIFDARLTIPAPSDIEVRDGLRLLKLPAALIECAPSQFPKNAIQMRAALAMVSDASEVLGRLLEGGNSTIAARLAGAFRNIGREQIADNIVQTMRAAGYTIAERDPFMDVSTVTITSRETSPYVNRMRMNWARMREDVLKHFPGPPGLTDDPQAYLRHVDDAYVTDAYNSLSIEGYKVSADLIERVRMGDWDPETIKGDREHHDALAARGYWQSFKLVKESVRQVLNDRNAGEIAEHDHRGWYRELFGPTVAAGILRPADLAGYRTGSVYVRRSMYSPPRAEAIRELMPAFFDLLQSEPEPAVRVVLGHFVFVYIHPYPDGNGRMGRFLMNLMTASGGYPWTIIPLDRRDDYMASLEKASVDQDIRPFSSFLAGLFTRI